MGVFISALLGGFVSIAGTMVGKILLSLGIGYAAYSGVDASITFAKTFLLGQMSGLPAQAVQVAGTLQLGRCISILTSALVARMTLNGMTAGTVKKMVTK